jgi:recombination protein RecA
MMRAAQEQGLRVAYFDTEQGLNPEWLVRQGVDIADDRFVFSRAYVAEDIFDVMEEMVRSGHFGLIVVDSVASMIAEREYEAKSVSDNFMGGKGAVMGKGLRRIAGPLAATNTALVFVNHLRDKVGMVFGEPTYRPGGKALDYACSLMLKVGKGDTVQEGKETVGFTIRVSAYKNRFRPISKAEEAEVRVYAHGGISRGFDLLQVGLETGAIEKKGAWFYLGERRLGHGEANVEAAISVDDELQAEIADAIAARDAAEE